MTYLHAMIPLNLLLPGAVGKTFDDLLGPSTRRYLADSYRRVQRHYRCTVDALDGAGTHLRIAGTTSLSYPADWSVGGSRAISPPHFSSVDAVLLTERIAARALAATRPPTDETVTLRHVRLRAGVRAETHLADIPVECEIGAPDGDAHATITARFGDMRVTATLDIRRHDGTPAVFPTDAVLTRTSLVIAGEIEPSHLGAQWASQVLRISEDGHLIDGVHSPTATGGADAATVSVLDLLRLSAQQAQALIYLRDGLERGSANSLWMRQAHFAVGRRDVPAGAPVALQLGIVRDQTLARGGATWRLFDVTATDGNGSEASASLAYLATAD